MKSFLPLVFLFILSFILIGLVTALVPSSPAKGYCDYVKANVDIDEIYKWLINYQFNEYDEAEFGRVFEENWPKCIKNLNPKNVLIRKVNAKKYMRIIYFFGPSAAFGLCVMEEPMDIPDYGDFPEKRIKLSDNTFAWAGD